MGHVEFWAMLERTDEKEEIVKACQCLESRATEFFASHKWTFILRSLEPSLVNLDHICSNCVMS